MSNNDRPWPDNLGDLGPSGITVTGGLRDLVLDRPDGQITFAVDVVLSEPAALVLRDIADTEGKSVPELLDNIVNALYLGGLLINLRLHLQHQKILEGDTPGGPPAPAGK